MKKFSSFHETVKQSENNSTESVHSLSQTLRDRADYLAEVVRRNHDFGLLPPAPIVLQKGLHPRVSCTGEPFFRLVFFLSR
jgi:hypothetical protein